MEKGGFKRLGRLFHHRSESEDSEPDLGKDTPLSSPCPSPCLEGRREHRASCSSTTSTVSGERKKRSAFGHWRLKKKQQQQSKDEEAAGDSAVPSALFAPSFDASEPTTPTNSYFDMPDMQYATQEKQQPLVPIQNSQYAYGISMDSISSSTLPTSFRKSKTRSSESSKELKKKAVLGKFGHFFTTGRRKNPKNTQETSSKPSIKIIRPESPHKNLAPLASIEIEDLNDLSKSEESLTDSIYEQNQSKTQNTIHNSEDYLYNRDLTPLYNDIVSEWDTKGISSGSEWSLDWHSSNETIKNTLFDSNLTLGTLEGENELVTDTNTTPDFFKSLSTLSDENLEQIILNHKELLEPLTFAESEYAESKDQPFFVEPKQDEHGQPSKILTLDIFLRRTEQQNLNKPVAVALDDDCSNTDIMDKKPAIRKSGKRRKSQSSSDVPNGDRNASENTVKEEPGFDGIPSDMVSEKISTSERKVRPCQQIMSPTNNNDIRSGSNHKGFTKSELERCKQQSPASSPYKKKSLKKNQSDAGPPSPKGIKSPGKNPSTKRQSDGIVDGNPASKCTSVEELPSDENIAVSPAGIFSNSSTSSPSEERTESQDLNPVRSSDGRVILQADKHKNDEVEGNGRQISFDLDEAKPRNICLDVSRTVTTKVSLPAKPKNVELNLKASKSLENLENEQDATDKVKINFSIANKISMFESKQNNQHQSADAPAPKRGSVSNTFVGRAKLKFGRQQTESEQTNKITNKGNHRQKSLQNGTKVKEISSDTNIKAQGKIEANITCEDVRKSEELGKVVKCQVNENDKVDGIEVNDFIFTKIDTELVKDKDLDNVSPIAQNEEIETNNWSMNAASLSPESEETSSLSSDHYFPNNNDKSLPQPDPVPQKSELNQISQFENKDQKVINTILEDNQEFEQNNSWQENQSSNCNISEGSSTDGICDSPSDMAKFTETLKNLDSSICIPQKKKKQKLPKSPAPHFAMPPIHEDNLEKIFDPNIFTVGLGVKRDRSQDLTPSVQLKLQSLETDARIRSKRASAENSLLLQSLMLPSRADSALMQEMSGKESKDSTDGDIKRSRLENSTIFSSLLAPATKEKKFTPSVTTADTITTSFASQKSATSPGIPPLIFDVTQKSEPLSGFKAPNYMDKYLQTDDTKRERILQMPNFGSLENSFSNWLKPGQCESNEFLAIETFSGKNQNKTNPRPGKVMICNKSDASENSFEVFHDVLDCTSWKLSPVILIKVIRGCWILYEKPNFEGVSIPMEEGELEFSNLWGEEAFDNEDTSKEPEPIVIGSIRHVVKDYRICRINLFTEPQGLGLVNAYFDDTEETRLGSSLKTCSIQVSWGIWLLYEEPGYQGIPLMLEPGEYPDLSCWEKKEAYIRSLKPLKMGGRKVEYPKSRKVIVYEKPFFEGKHIELDSELAALAKEGDRTEESEELENELLTSIGSIKVKAGIWVAYEKSEFEGHQYLLEEGEYQEWTDWGGYDEQLQSLRPVLGDLMHPHMIMYTEKDFGNKGSSINVLGIISNLKDTGYGLRTQSINVISGVWVAYENPDFTGEQYILDKGMYSNYEAWGAKNNKISSVQPILLDIINEHVGKFKVQLFSEPEFQGSSQIFEKDISQIVEFPAKSSKVLSGSWIAYDKENFSGNQYVLEEGAYPDLSAMGCLPQTCLKSLQVVNIELSEPVITLFEKENFRGKKFEFITEIVNLQFLGYNPHIASIEVHGGIWIIYEHHNYKGRQILLTPKKISNWKETSGYHKIGSLRPLLQRQVYFRLRNKETGKFMAADGNMDDLSLLRIQAVEDNKSGEQIWLYQDGFIKSRGAEDICLTIVGNLITPGTKLGLALQQNDEKQNWSFNSDGKIYSKMKPNLVLDIKGGNQYDQNHLILSTASEDRPTQYWEPLII